MNWQQREETEVPAVREARNSAPRDSQSLSGPSGMAVRVNRSATEIIRFAAKQSLGTSRKRFVVEPKLHEKIVAQSLHRTPSSAHEPDPC